MDSISSIHQTASEEAAKKIAVLEHLAGQIADILSDIQGQPCKYDVDLHRGFVLVWPAK